MRQILVDQARRKAARKHGGDLQRVDMGSDELAIDAPDQDMLDLDRALDLLQERDARAAEIVSLRFFAGLSAPETANVLGVSLSTVEREWRFSRAFLRSILKSGQS
jgi:RNA polymerase sigma factor (TIGR02999 family)